MGSLQFDGHDTCHVSKNINKTMLQKGWRICCFFSLRTNKICHSDGNRKAKDTILNAMENRKLCITEEQTFLTLGNFQFWWLLNGAQLRKLTNTMSAPNLNSHRALFWNLKWEIEHLQGRTVLQKRKMKLFLIPHCHRWPADSLCVTHAIHLKYVN